MHAISAMKCDILTPQNHQRVEVLTRHLHTGVPQLDVREQKDLLEMVPDHSSFLQLVSLAFFATVFCTD